MLLQGKNYDGAKAKRLGLVHEVVPAGEVVAAAKKMILGGLKPVQPWDEKGFKLPGGPVYSAQGAQLFPPANAIYRRETYDNYPGARAIMKCVYEGLLLPMDAALRVESRYFAHVLTTTEAGMMIRSLFLSHAGAEQGRAPSGQRCGLDHQEGRHPWRRRLHGRRHRLCQRQGAASRWCCSTATRRRRTRAAPIATTSRTKAIGRGASSPQQKEALLSRIRATTDYADLADCDLVIEAVFEDSNVKKTVTEAAAKHMKAGAIFASNTSTIPITGLAKNFPDAKRFHRHPLLLAGRPHDADRDHHRQEDRRQGAGRGARLCPRDQEDADRRQRHARLLSSTAACCATCRKPTTC